MLQNIKNLIRHGKNAPLSLDNNSLPQTNSILSVTENSPNQNISYQNQGVYNTEKSTSNRNSGSSYNKNPEISPKKTTTSKSYKSNYKEYEKAIAQLVAEEREQTRLHKIYPGLDDWIIGKKMGDGAFSVVHQATNKKTGKEAAIKIVQKRNLSASQRAAILKEVTVMRNINHPNVIKLLGFLDLPEYYYVILEFAPGGEIFHQIVRLTYFSEDLARHVITQVALAIRHLHEECGVVHRDIKPENILYYPIEYTPSENSKVRNSDTPDKEDEGVFIPGVGGGTIGVIKVADFGLSKVIWDLKTMTPCGTVGYTAPEIVKDEKYSKAVDMWALGCVLYTILCGFPPFYDESIEVLTRKVAKGQYTFLSPWWDDISKSAKDLVSHLLTVDPETRYTIDEFLAHPWITQSNEPTQPAADAPTVQEYDDLMVAYDDDDYDDDTIDEPILSIHDQQLNQIDINETNNNLPVSNNDIKSPINTETTLPINSTENQTTKVINTPDKGKIVSQTVNSIERSSSGTTPTSAHRSHRRRHHEFRSPAIISLRDGFDVSYAVHRIEEEKRTRQKYGYNHRTFDDNLNDLIEEEEEEEEESAVNVSDNYGNKNSKQNKGDGINAVTSQLRNVSVSNPTKKSSKARSKRSERDLFELNISAATLLEKRRKKRADQTTNSQLDAPQVTVA